MPRVWTAAQRQQAWAAGTKAYNKLTPEEQDALKAIFNAADVNGDRTWSWQEFSAYVKGNAAFRLNYTNILDDLWGLLDVDGDGTLDFYEVGTLFYFLSLDMSTCDLCCQVILDDAMWACRSCCTRYIRSHMRDGNDWAVVCTGCYGGGAMQPTAGGGGVHKACGGRMELVPHDPLVSTTQCPLFRELLANAGMYGTACLCCGVVHAHVASYLSATGSRGRHMLQSPDGRGFVCELCTSWVCDRCGASGCDPKAPQLGRWSQKQKHLSFCMLKGLGGWQFDKMTLAREANDTSREQCPACQVLFRQQAPTYQLPQQAPQPPLLQTLTLIEIPSLSPPQQLSPHLPSPPAMPPTPQQPLVPPLFPPSSSSSLSPWSQLSAPQTMAPQALQQALQQQQPLQQQPQPQAQPQPQPADSSSSSAVSCVCCGLAHERVPAYLSAAGTQHVLPAPGGQGFVCELCAVWICERCGDSQCNPETPEIGRWRKSLVHGTKCKKRGKGGWGFELGELANTALGPFRQQCGTCRSTFAELQARQQLLAAQPVQPAPARDGGGGNKFEDLSDAAVAGVKVGAAVASAAGCCVM